jgi:hypothetical protein
MPFPRVRPQVLPGDSKELLCLPDWSYTQSSPLPVTVFWTFAKCL